MLGVQDNSKESDDSSTCEKLALPSSPKGEIVGILVHMLYLMATHSSQMINYSATKFTHFHEDKSLFHVEKSSRTFMRRKVYFM